ncbi:signal peptidase complex subunit 3-like [Symsagittifera roscoffensis]|uniref:signal peptidase complex subunit 3-like n=1 Tax=Symsagittifera roscoffensis TaxID=84072 RepID=UPI00307C44AA
MHSFSSRLNALFAFFLSVMGAVAFGCFASTFYKNYNIGVPIKKHNITLRSAMDFTTSRQESDLATIKFSIDGNLSNLFDWNTKQIFMYLVCEYQSANNQLNQVVLWDRIMLREDADVEKFSVDNLSPKYYFFDDGANLRGLPAKLVLRWNVIPNSGYMPFAASTDEVQFEFPKQYTAIPAQARPSHYRSL